MLVRSVFVVASAVGLILSACVRRAPTAVNSPTGSVGAGTSPTRDEAWLIVTSPSTPFVRSRIAAKSADNADIVVLTSQPLQTITGFGGAFNEQGWEALSVLSASERNAVMRALFDPIDGLRFNMGRLPVGASDYALDRYTLDESPGDYSMRDFSISRDKQRLIPYIQAALKVRSDLTLWASWATKHYSGLIDSGAKLVQTTGHYLDGIAFVNPDGTNVVELLNAQTNSVHVVVSVDNRTYAVQLPPTSLATVMVPGR